MITVEIQVRITKASGQIIHKEHHTDLDDGYDAEMANVLDTGKLSFWFNIDLNDTEQRMAIDNCVLNVKPSK